MKTREINIEEYYVKYGAMVFRRCRAILRDEDAAFDAMQEVFVKLLQKKNSLRDEFPSSLLYRMASNTCFNILRGCKTETVHSENSVIANLVYRNDEIERFVENDSIDYLFSGEKILIKNIAKMHFVEKMTFKEIADEIGRSESGVRRCLRTFRNRVQYLREEVL